FGETHAVDGVDFTVNEGEVLALIGSNGAGKTSLVNVVSGLLSPDSGNIVFRGADVTDLSVHDRIHAGIARSFQLVNLFDHLTLLDNVALSIFSREDLTRKLLALADHHRGDHRARHGRGLQVLGSDRGHAPGQHPGERHARRDPSERGGDDEPARGRPCLTSRASTPGGVRRRSCGASRSTWGAGKPFAWSAGTARARRRRSTASSGCSRCAPGRSVSRVARSAICRPTSARAWASATRPRTPGCSPISPSRR